MMRFATRVSVVFATGVLGASLASASVTGTTQTSAASGGGSITVTNNSITFSPGSFGACPQNAAPPYSDGTSFCDFSISSAGMSYSGGPITTSFNGIFGDLVLSPSSIQQPFITIDTPAGAAAAQFTLQTFIAPSTTKGTNCAGTGPGDTCVVYNGSPFTILGIAGGTGTGGEGSTVSLSVSGTVKDALDNSVSIFTGKLTETLNNMAPVDLQNLFAPGGIPSSNASINTGDTGSFTATVVPEPATVSMLLIGGGLVAFIRKRKK